MKKFMLVAAMGALVFAAPAAWSQNAAGSPPAGGGQPPAMGAGGGAGGPPQDNMKFAERKADILNHINQHLAEVTQRKQCVEAAQTHEALRACMPPPREGRGGNGGMPENGQGGSGGSGGSGGPPQ